MNDEQNRRKVWAAGVAANIQRLDGWEVIDDLAQIAKMRKQGLYEDANLLRNDLSTSHRSMMQRTPMTNVNSFRDYPTARAVTFYDDLGSNFPWLLPFTQRLKGAVENDASVIRDERSAYTEELLKRNGTAEAVIPRTHETLQRLQEQFATDAEFKEAYNSTFGRDLGFADATIAETTARFPAISEVGAEIQAGAVDRQVQEKAANSGSAQIKKIQEANTPRPVEDDNPHLNQLDADTPTAIEQIAKNFQDREAAQRKESEARALEDGLRGIVQIYAAFGGNPRSVAQVNAVISIGAALRKAQEAYLVDSVASPKMAGFALAGNWLMAGFAVAALFQPAEEDPFQATVLRALRGIADQLVAIEREMQQGFSALENDLQQLAKTIASSFDEVLTWEKINFAELTRVRESAANAASLLVRSADLLNTKLDYLVENAALKSLEDVLEYGRNLSPLPEDRYVAGCAHLVRYLADVAQEPALSGPSFRTPSEGLEYLVQGRTEAVEFSKGFNSYRSLFKLSGRRAHPAAAVQGVLMLLELRALAGEDAKYLPRPVQALGTEIDGNLGDLRHLRAPENARALFEAFEMISACHKEALGSCVTAINNLQADELQKVHASIRTLPALTDLSESQRLLTPRQIGPLGNDEGAKKWLEFFGPETVMTHEGAAATYPDPAHEKSRNLRRSLSERTEWPNLEGEPLPWSESRHALAISLTSLGVGKLSYGYVAGFTDHRYFGHDNYEFVGGLPRVLVAAELELNGVQAVVEVLFASEERLPRLIWVEDRPYLEGMKPLVYNLRGALNGVYGPFPINWIAGAHSWASQWIDTHSHTIDSIQEALQKAYTNCSTLIRTRINQDCANPASPLATALARLDSATAVIQNSLTWICQDVLAADSDLFADVFSSLSEPAVSTLINGAQFMRTVRRQLDGDSGLSELSAAFQPFRVTERVATALLHTNDVRARELEISRAALKGFESQFAPVP